MNAIVLRSEAWDLRRRVEAEIYQPALGASMARATIAMAALGETFRKFSAAAEEAALIMKALVGIGWTPIRLKRWQRRPPWETAGRTR
jgi:hypothetical protein